MDPSVIVAFISFIGTVVGTFAGILASAKLSNYRISELEKKVDKHNTVIERTYKLETEYKLLKEDVQELHNTLNHA